MLKTFHPANLELQQVDLFVCPNSYSGLQQQTGYLQTLHIWFVCANSYSTQNTEINVFYNYYEQKRNHRIIHSPNSFLKSSLNNSVWASESELNRSTAALFFTTSCVQPKLACFLLSLKSNFQALLTGTASYTGVHALQHKKGGHTYKIIIP